MKTKILFLFVFGLTFAVIEAATVSYLRILVGPNFPQKTYPIVLNLGFIAFGSAKTSVLQPPAVNSIELAREAATLLMILSVSLLAARSLVRRIGAFLIVFSLWDLFYYVFLRIFSGWPQSLWNTDVYFLLPAPWFGPVITPVILSTILFLVGLKLYL
ncbi:MAG: hypothetical protein M1352_01230 [Patescibacteria group bacterium]|nr:hypothetical protein [Patescibacteria group bacterium]